MGDAEAATTLAALVTTLATSLERVNTTLRSGFVSMTDAITSTSTGAKSATTPGNAVSRARSRRRGSTRHRVVSHTMGVSGARRAGVIDPTAARRADGADNGRGLRQNHKRVFLAANATLHERCARSPLLQSRIVRSSRRPPQMGPLTQPTWSHFSLFLTTCSEGRYVFSVEPRTPRTSLLVLSTCTSDPPRDHCSDHATYELTSTTY